MLTELSVELNAPKLRQDIAPGAPAMGEDGPPGALTRDIVEQLRKQLEAQGHGDKGLMEALEKQVPPGAPGAAPTQAPAGEPPAAPQGAAP
jgi:hypothetical protein